MRSTQLKTGKDRQGGVVGMVQECRNELGGDFGSWHGGRDMKWMDAEEGETSKGWCLKDAGL